MAASYKLHRQHAIKEKQTGIQEINVGSITKYVPGYVEDLIRATEASGEKKVKWLLADVNLGFCFQGAKNLGVRVAAVWPAAAGSLATWFTIPKMIEDGFIDDKGMKDPSFYCLVSII